MSRFRILIVSQHIVHPFYPDFPDLPLRVIRFDAHLHAVNDLTHRTGLELIPIGIRNQRSAFRHAVTHCIAEMDRAQEMFHLFIQCRATDNHLFEVIAERLVQPVCNLPSDSISDERDLQQELD